MKQTPLFKSPPAKAINAGAVTYKHQYQGFRLVIPAHLHFCPRQIPRHTIGSCDVDVVVQLGPVMLGLHHDSRTIHGNVPESWLVDLNADGAAVDESELLELA